MNGFINEFTSSLENAGITFQCSSDSGVVNAVCSVNGSWVPNPILLCNLKLDIAKNDESQGE